MMPSAITHASADQQTSVKTVWQIIKQHLATEKDRIFQEIHYYPPPIPACDVQFNSLLVERSAVLKNWVEWKKYLSVT